MTWILLYFWFIGAVNDWLMAASMKQDDPDSVDLGSWATHLNVVLWPITVPATILYAYFMLRQKD